MIELGRYGAMWWRPAVSIVLGVTLITLGLVGYHVEAGAIIAGAILLGLISLDGVLEAFEVRRRRRPDDPDGRHPS